MPQVASISLDLDNLWAYLKTQGAEGWQSFPTFLPTAVPRILSLLKELDQRITFFLVGKDATLAENAEPLAAIAAAGHEIGNHSFLHEPWLHLYSEAELKAELDSTESAILAATGAQVTGFRGPGFSSSPLLRQILLQRGYRYEASEFPTVIGPVARAYFFLFSKLSPEEKKKRSGLYGRVSAALGSLHPYEIQPGLMEMPVTTMPLTRLPVHMSYLLFLAQRSMALAKAYWWTTVQLCRLRKVSPSLLLHPTDFLDVQDAPQMSFFPAMSVPHPAKLELVSYVIRLLQQHYRVGTLADHAASASLSPTPPHSQQFSTTATATHP
jgi:peptidoglycan-N-acetylglucosamine deacetylase